MIEELIDDTLAWASDLSEQWVGTTTGKIIDAQQASVIKAVENGDLESARLLVYELGQTLDYVEKE